MLLLPTIVHQSQFSDKTGKRNNSEHEHELMSNKNVFSFNYGLNDMRFNETNRPINATSAKNNHFHNTVKSLLAASLSCGNIEN